jgi:hypothetical protein
LLTDAPSEAFYTGGAWRHYIGTQEVVPPVLGDFSQVNFGTSSTAGLGPFTSVVPQTTGASYDWRLLEKAAPATPYSIEFGFYLPPQLPTWGYMVGGGWREAATGELVLVYIDASGAQPLLRVVKFNSPTSAASVYYSESVTQLDSADRFVDFYNGGYWQNIHSVTRADFLTPDRVCFGVVRYVTTLPERIHWLDWAES